MVKWPDTNGFKFSYNNTVVIHFCKIRKFHLAPDLYLKNHRIPCVEETRVLGLIFDKKLTWVPHLKAVKTKCMKALEILRVLSHTTWCSDRKTLLRLHHSLIDLCQEVYVFAGVYLFVCLSFCLFVCNITQKVKDQF